MPDNNPTTKFKVDISELKSGIAEANKNIKLANAEFKAASAGMDDWSKSSDGISAKLKQLGSVLDSQKSKLSNYKKQQEALDDAYAENGKRADELRESMQDLASRGISKTSAEYKALEKALVEVEKEQAANKKASDNLKVTILNQQAAVNKTEKEIRNYEDSLNKVQEAEKKAAKSGKSVEESLKDIEGSAKDAGDGFTVAKGALAGFIADGLTALVGKAAEAVSSLMSLSEETQEYREDMNKLETAFETAGKSTELATDTYKNFYSVLGEEDRSVEAVNHLAKFVETEEDMVKWTDIAAGVWGTFGDSLPIEGLTEAANETAKVGKVTGPLADALNWAGVNEDKFNESLEKCNTEQERAQLITDTLNELYEEASKNYKENNEGIIEARNATSDYTDAQAELGEAMEPVQTNITNLKTELLKELAPTLKEEIVPAIGDFIDDLKKTGVLKKFTKMLSSLATSVLPHLTSALEFIVDNLGSMATGILVAVAAWKTMTIVTSVTTAIKGATGAMGILNAVMSANPIGTVVTALGLLAGAIGAVTIAITNNKSESEIQNEKAKEQLETIQQEKDAYYELKAAQDVQAEGDLAQLDHLQKLNDELGTLVDENGNVTEANQGRVDFILGELNEALGTEYELTGNQIEGYQDLQREIANTIEVKKAETLLANQLPLYEEAISKYMEKQMEQAKLAQDISAQQSVIADKDKEYADAQAEHAKMAADAVTESDFAILASNGFKLEKLRKDLEAEKDTLKTKENAYSENEELLRTYYSDISEYETASTKLLEGKTKEAIKILESKDTAFTTAADVVGKSAEDQKKILEQQVIDTEVNAQLMKARYEEGVEGVTEEMVKTAQEQADAAKEEFYKVGGDITKGIAEGAEEEEWTLTGAMKGLIDKALSAAKKAAGIKSPARKFKKPVGGMIGLGVAGGVDESTPAVVKSVENQVESMADAYKLNTDAFLNGVVFNKKSNWLGEIASKVGGKTTNGVPVNNVVNHNVTNNFNQTNNSPKALSRLEIYRQTKNQFNFATGVISHV